MTIKIYSTPACVYCKKAKQMLQENNVAYQEIDVAKDAEARQYIFEKTGRLSVPIIEVDNKIFVGYNEQVIKETLGIGGNLPVTVASIIGDPAEVNQCDSCQ